MAAGPRGRRERQRHITAPLVAGAPKALDVTIPCATVATLPRDGGVVFPDQPAGGIEAGRNGMFVRANADVVYVAFRDSVAAVAPRAAVDSGACSQIHVWANVGAVGADFGRHPGATGRWRRQASQVSGLFTDLKVPAQLGLGARVDVDTRFITAPTALKSLVMFLGVACYRIDHRADPAGPRRGQTARARAAAGWACGPGSPTPG